MRFFLIEYDLIFTSFIKKIWAFYFHIRRHAFYVALLFLRKQII
jgi:hypothetical protein